MAQTPPKSGEAEREWMERWLSKPRLATYLDRCNNRTDEAYALYEWNTELGLALLKDVAFFEIALRNTYDRVLREHWKSDVHWLVDPASPVNVPIARRARSGATFDANELNRGAIKKALSASPSGAHSVDSAIANLPLGFWAHMTDRAHERVLWIPSLHRAWPPGTNRARLNAQIRAIAEIRNRIAHHEHLFDPKTKELSPLAVGHAASSLFEQLMGGPNPLSGHRDPAVERFLERNPMPVKATAHPARTITVQEQEGRVRRYFSMWVERDFADFDALFADTCVYEECYGPIYEGRAELRRWIDHMLAHQRVRAWDIHSLVPAADGQTLAVTWTFSAEEDGRSYVFDGCSLVRFDAAGRIDHVREYGATHERRRPFAPAVAPAGAHDEPRPTGDEAHELREHQVL